MPFPNRRWLGKHRELQRWNCWLCPTLTYFVARYNKNLGIVLGYLILIMISGTYLQTIGYVPNTYLGTRSQQVSWC